MGRQKARGTRAAKGAVLAAFAPLLMVSLAVGPLAVAGASDQIGELAGRWSGWGSITMESGASEQVKCVATYSPRDDSRALTQSLRCASKSYRLDAEAELRIEQDGLSGRWIERTYAAEGSISGRLTGEGFRLFIRGDNFAAAMTVGTSVCRQSIAIVPEGLGIRRIAVALQKC